MLNYSLKLIGYKKLFNYFVDLELNKKLPSKILLSGQEGIGKSTFALHFANYLFSKNEITKYKLEENKVNPDSISFNLLNNISHPNFNYISKNDKKKISKLIK